MEKKRARPGNPLGWGYYAPDLPKSSYVAPPSTYPMTVSCFLASSFGWSYDAVRERLSEFHKEAPAKSGFWHGSKRRDFDVSTCFAPLPRWVPSSWSGHRLALAIDVTNRGERVRSPSDLFECVGGSMHVEGRDSTGEKMPRTLLARYAEGYREPWFLLTDLPPETGEAVWYAFRARIE